MTKQDAFVMLGKVSEVEWDVINRTSISVLYGGGDLTQDSSIR